MLQRFPTDKAYFIAKELLTTERTYLKDLELITLVITQRIGDYVYDYVCVGCMDKGLVVIIPRVSNGQACQMLLVCIVCV